MKKIVSYITILALMISMFITLTISIHATGSTYYVSPSGNDSNPGTFASPWKTLQSSCGKLTAGDTMYVRGGVYNELVTISCSGSSNAYITICNYPEENPVIDGTGKSVSGDTGLILIQNKSYLKIIGLELRNFQTTGTESPVGIRVIGSPNNIEIRNCKIHDIKTLNESGDANAHGIAVHGTNGSSPANNITLDNNEVYNCKLGQSESVVLNGNVTNFHVNNNIIHDNDNIGIDFIGFEGTASSNDQARDGECIGNLVYNITSVGNPTYTDACADGIYVDGGKNILIERNIVHNADIGIEAASEHEGKVTEYITIRNNLVYDCNAQAGISFGGASSENGTAENLKIFNNTLYNSVNIQISNANSNTNIIKNNIMNGGTAISGTIGNNVFASNITAAAQFVSVSNKNFRLQSSSPAINAGVTVDYGSLDLDGNTRVAGNAVDCGAYETQSGTPTPTSTAIPTSAPTAPVISSVQAGSITSSGATITWTTDQASNSVVEYGTTTSYGSSATGSNGVTSHSVTLTGLSASTQYHFRVKSTNSGNLTATSTDDTFTTSGGAQTETTADDGNSGITYDSDWTVYNDSGDFGGSHHETKSASKYATFTFTGTSIKWISQKDNNYGKADVYIDNVKVTTVDLYASSTQYQQVVYSNQALSSGMHTIKIVCTGTKNSSSSDKYVTIDAFKYYTESVTPTPTPTPCAPVISSVRTGSITSSGTTIIWTTDQASNSVVEYGISTSYGSIITGSSGVTSHSAALTGLTASTLYHFRVKSTNSGNLTTTSADYTFTTSEDTPPVSTYNVYYGMLHNHSALSDGQGTPAEAYAYAKNNAQLDFFGLADHGEELSSAEWNQMKNAANQYNQDGVYATFYGFEWSSSTYGHVAVTNSQEYTSSDDCGTFDQLVSWLNSRDCAAFFNHPGRENSGGTEFNHFTTLCSKFVGMELWNNGNDGETFSQYYYNNGYYQNDSNAGFYDEALIRGLRIGAAGSADNHDGTWGTENGNRLAVLAGSKTRASIFDALLARRFFSTLDKNLILSFKINGNEMGSEITSGIYNAVIKAGDGDAEQFTSIELLKNGAVIGSWTPNTANPQISQSVSCNSGDYFYVRVKQLDNDEAISSPIKIN